MITKINGLIDRRVTTGNLATIAVFIVAWAISGAIWYSQVQGHVLDKEVHRTTAEEQTEIDKRVRLLTEAQTEETQRRLESIEKTQAEIIRVLYRIQGTIDKGR